MFLNTKNGFKKILGIDPAKEIAAEASANGIETIPNYMNKSNAELIKNKYGLANIITANNVCAHVDSLQNFIKGIANLLDREGIFTFEVSYLGDVITKKTFDVPHLSKNTNPTVAEILMNILESKS